MLYRLLKQLASSSVKTVVIDNASTDESLDALVFADYVIRNDKNRLYAKAANQGIEFVRKMDYSKILLLNCDLKLTDDFLNKLIKAKGEIVGPVIGYNKFWSRGGKLDIYKGIIEQ